MVGQGAEISSPITITEETKKCGCCYKKTLWFVHGSLNAFFLPVISIADALLITDLLI
jgi:hypothetical protein